MTKFRKNYYLLFLFFIAGTIETVSAQDSLEAAQKAVILSVLDSVRSKDSEVQPIGVFRLNNKPIKRYYKFNKDDDPIATGTILIDSITIEFFDGAIIDLQVFAGDKKFTNTVPIDLRKYRMQLGTDLLRASDRKNDKIIFQDIFLVDSLTDYIPSDGFYKLTRINNKLVMYRKVGINTVLDLRLFTDALGIFGNSPNGIIQTDVRFKQMINLSNSRNRALYFGKYFKFNFNACKFTSGNSIVDSAHFSRVGLMQKSYLSAELPINVLSSSLGFKSTSMFYIDAGPGLSYVSVVRNKDTSAVVCWNWFFEAGINFKSSRNIGCNVYFRGIDQYSPSTDWNNNNTGHFFLRGGLEIYYSPLDDATNRLFARINATFATSKDEVKSGYAQFQIGYSVLLSSLVKK